MIMAMNTPQKKTYNEELKDLVNQSGLSQQGALDLFNSGRTSPYTLSSWKAFLASPTSARWRPFNEDLWHHAEKTLGPASPDEGSLPDPVADSGRSD